MPTKPSYCRDLPHGTETTAGLPNAWIVREDPEIVIGISKTVAGG